MGASRSRIPSWTARKTARAVKLLDIDWILKNVSGVTGVCCDLSVWPYVLSHRIFASSTTTTATPGISSTSHIAVMASPSVSITAWAKPDSSSSDTDCEATLTLTQTERLAERQKASKKTRGAAAPISRGIIDCTLSFTGNCPFIVSPLWMSPFASRSLFDLCYPVELIGAQISKESARAIFLKIVAAFKRTGW